MLVYTGIEKEPTTRQLEFENLSGVEMHAGDYMIGGSHWEVYVITSAGERVLVNKSQTTTLEQYARTVSKHLRPHRRRQAQVAAPHPPRHTPPLREDDVLRLAARALLY